MKITLLLPVFAVCAFAQESQTITLEKRAVEMGTTTALAIPTADFRIATDAPKAVTGAPYSGTMVTETVQTLADGNRIVHKSQGLVARDSQGRTRTETPLPSIGNMSAQNTPMMVFINDPVAGVIYTVNGVDKSFRKTVFDSKGSINLQVKQLAETKMVTEGAIVGAAGVAGPQNTFFFRSDLRQDAKSMAEMKRNAEKSIKTESLGSKVFDGVLADGTRTTHTIAAGEIGNEKPIETVSEVWFSRELGTMIYFHTSDPRMGENTRTLTNISRSEPDPTLFAPPADFTEATSDSGKGTVIFRTKD